MKKLIAISITVIMLVLPIEAFAEGRLTYGRAVALTDLNNSTSKKLKRAESDALRQYESSVLKMSKLDENGFTFKYGDTEYFNAYGADTRFSLSKMKQLVPEQMKFAWESARDNRTVTNQTLNTNLRSVFFGVYRAQADMELKQKQLALTSEINTQDKLKQKMGIITLLDLEESGYNLVKAQKDLDAAKRNYENASRSFNQYVGLPAETRYSQIINDDRLSRPAWKPVDYYVAEALKNRLDITGIQKQLALKELDKKLTEAGYAYKYNMAEQETYQKLLTDIEQLRTDLERTKLSIESEIKNAYTDVIQSGKSVDIMGNTLKLQQSSYEKLQARYKAGMITKSTLTQAEIGLEQTENSYNALIYDYNTRIMRFKNATGIGPGY